MANTDGKIRINKYLADKGIATRKGADELVSAGRVFVNSVKAVLGQKVTEGDKVEVREGNGGGAAQTPRRYLAYNKPADVVTHTPVENEKSIADIFKMDGLFPVGRLDKNSEGLLILTNDGRVTDRLLNPKYEHEKEYEVETERTVGESFAKKLESGIHIGEDGKTKPCKVNLIDSRHFNITLTEGKKHQVKRMTESLGVSVKNLKRVRIMNVKLGNLSPNHAREITGKELETFLKNLGLDIAERLNSIK